MTSGAPSVYAARVAADEVRDDPRADDDAATTHDGDAEPGTETDGEAASVPGDGEPTVLDVLKGARDDLATMVEAIESEQTEGADLDGMLDHAHAAIVSVLDGEKCPMCQGDGLLATTPPDDPRAERCADCGGMGKVYTGSLVPESAVRPCGKCAGAGFTERASVTPLPGADYTAPPAPAGAQWYDEHDAGTWHLPIDPAKRGLTLG